MKLEEIKVGKKVKVIRVKKEVGPEEHYIGNVGEVIEIIPNVPYPIVVDFGYKTGVFRPEELVKV